MHENFDEETDFNEWDAVLSELNDDIVIVPEQKEKDELKAIARAFSQDPVYLTIGISLESGVSVSTDGDNDILMISLLASLFNGDIDDEILAAVPKYKMLFPSWGDESPMIYPDKTLWEGATHEQE